MVLGWDASSQQKFRHSRIITRHFVPNHKGTTMTASPSPSSAAYPSQPPPSPFAGLSASGSPAGHLDDTSPTYSIEYDGTHEYDSRVVVSRPSSISLSPRADIERPPMQTITEAELLAGLAAAEAEEAEKEQALGVPPSPVIATGGLAGSSSPAAAANAVPRTRSPEPSSGGCFSCCFGGGGSSKPASSTSNTARRPSAGAKASDPRRLSTASGISLSPSTGSQLFQANSAFVSALNKTASFVGFSQLVADPSTPSELLLPLGPPSLNKEVYLSTPRVIGWGAEGTIRVVKRQRDGQFLVAKVFKPAQNRIHFIRGSFEYTIGHLTRGHPNLVAVIDLTRANDMCFTVMEYVPGGNLRMAMSKPGYLRSQALVDGIFVQLCRAILWMHAMGVAHRDIKLENIMWHPRRPLVKLADFGNADIFWTPKGFADDTFESLSTLGTAAFDKANVKQERHLSEVVLKGCGMTADVSAGQMVTSMGGDLRYLAGDAVAASKTGAAAAANGAKPAASGKNKMFIAGDSDSDETDDDDDDKDSDDEASETRSTVSGSADHIPRPHLDDPTSPSMFYRFDVSQAEEAKIHEGAFKGFLPVSPSEFRKPSRYWNPATKTGSVTPPQFSPTDDPTSRTSPIRLSFGVVGTTAYIAPEQFLAAGRRPSPEEPNGWYDPRPVDVWMIAIAWIYSSTRRIPWASATDNEIGYKRWREGKGSKVMDDWKDQKLPTFDSKEDQRRYFKSGQTTNAERLELVKKMLELDPSKRITLQELVTEPVYQRLSEDFERRSKGLAERGFYLDLSDAPKSGPSFAAAT